VRISSAPQTLQCLATLQESAGVVDGKKAYTLKSAVEVLAKFPKGQVQ